MAGPVVADDAAVSVRTLVVDVLAGLKAAVTPLGNPDADRLTVPPKPPVGVTVIVLVLLPPCARLNGPVPASSNPVLTGPASVAASTITSRLLGRVTLCTILLTFKGKEYP